MELMESNDAKNRLVIKSARHKQELEDEVRLISANTEKIITNTLIIGGTLAVTYFLVRRFTGTKSKRRSKTKKEKFVRESDDRMEASSGEDTSASPGIVSQIGSALAAQATVFLLDLAKDKLSEFVKTHFEKKVETTNERT
ncbi:MAG TPA: hypothetical protein VJ184_04595 [Chryseolinea sp.]|nr:hypothetical protein [Chryseolinea sp.]